MVVNRSAPRATVVPILVYEDVAKAIDWLCDTFGFTERLRAAGPGGSVTHAQLAIAEGAVMLGRQGGEFRAPRPNEVSQYVHVHVQDLNEHFEHAQQRGARILKSPTDMPFGERQYTVEDPWGHRWTFSQSITDVAPEAWGARQPGPTGGLSDPNKGRFAMKLISLLFIAVALAGSTNRGRPISYEQTQASLNEAAGKDLKAAETEMTQVLGQLMKKAVGKADAIAKLTKAQSAWKAYRDAQVEAIWPFPERRQYGSVYPMCVANELTNLTKTRVAELRRMLTSVEGDACSPQWPD